MPTREIPHNHLPLCPPVVNPPRRIPHSKRDLLKKDLDCMETVAIIEKDLLNEPADWASSQVCVNKSDGSIRVCLKPRDLKCAIKQKHYPMCSDKHLRCKLLYIRAPFARAVLRVLYLNSRKDA